MNIKLLPFLICFLIVVNFTSCKKEDSLTNKPAVDSTTVNKSDSTLLKLFVKLDTLHPATKDTLYKMAFGYDNLKRLSTFDYSYYDSATGIFIYNYHLTTQYNGNDSLPNKVIFQPEGYPKEDEIEMVEYINGNLSTVKYTFPNDIGINRIMKINYLAQGDMTIYYNNPNVLPNDTIYHKEVLNNGNVLSDERRYNDLNFLLFQGTYTYENLFDNFPNPFKRVAFIFQLLDYFYAEDPGEAGGFNYIMAKSKNNILRSKFNNRVYTFDYENDYAKTYIYNKNNLPISASYTKQLSQQNQYYAGKELYYYTK